MYEQLRLLAASLANKGKQLKFKPDGLLGIYNLRTENDMNIVAEKLANIVSNEVGLIKNKINPTIKDFAIDVKEQIDGLKRPTPSDKFLIEQFFMPEVIKTIKFKGNLHSYDNVNLPVSALKLKSLPKEDIIKLMKTGLPDVDNFIKDFINEIGDLDLEDVWNTYMVNISNSNFNIRNLQSNFRVEFKKVFVLYLILNNLFKNDNFDIIDLGTTKEYRFVITEFYKLISNLVVVLYNQYDKWINNKTVIISLKQDENVIKIYVVQDNYLEFLSGEGEIENIFGAALLNISYASIDVLKNKKDDTEDKWNKFVAMFNVDLNVKNVSSYRLAYRVAFLDLVFKHLDSLENIIDPEIKNNTERKISEYLYKLSIDELMDINRTSEKILTDLIFNYTNAGEFLSYMREYSKIMGDETTPKQAATFATLKLTVEFLLSQIEVD